MSKHSITIFQCNEANTEKCTKAIIASMKKKSWIQLLSHQSQAIIGKDIPWPQGPGIILSSGGSVEGPHHCLHSFNNLDQSASATAEWLKEAKINPYKCIILNPLPMNHISGLMPWWRSRKWKVPHIWLTPSLMREPNELLKFFKDNLSNPSLPIITSLVPTQLKRLLEIPSGELWLQALDLIWVGGAELPHGLATEARKKNIPLAPCYGSTETAAMVCALSPEQFLKGEFSSGNPLKDVELKIDSDQTLQIRTPRLAIAQYKEGKLHSLRNQQGWWSSGDIAKFTTDKRYQSIRILGRRDNAILSGGETVFPERLESQLLNTIKTSNLPIENLLLIGVPDDIWGQSLAALIRFKENSPHELSRQIIDILRETVAHWSPAQRPRSWHNCPDLATNIYGKWNRSKWIASFHSKKYPLI